MKFRTRTSRNIALLRPCYNRPRWRPGWRACEFAGLLASAGIISLASCHRPASPAVELPAWSLTSGQPVHLTPLAQVRVSPDRPLPAHLIQRLCPEYALLVVSRRGDWAEVCRRLALPARLLSIDLSTGPVIGVLAEVGQNADDDWPIRLVSIRNTTEGGKLEATFVHGVYYPVRTAAYLDLAKLTGTTTITTVRINSRVFTIHPRAFN